MPNTWNELPPEILEIIFTGADRQELFQYELVCQNWKCTAQRLAYAELEFYKFRDCKLDNVDGGGDDLVTRLKRWIANLQVSDQGPWIHVKTLNSGLIWDEPLVSNTQATYLDRFAELFPALEHLDIRNPDTAFYARLVELHKDGKWDNLKMIAEPRDNQSIPAYVETALEFCESLTHLEVADKIVNFGGLMAGDIGFHTREYDLLVKRIQTFMHLTSIKICKYDNRAGNIDLETFDSIIDSCKALTSAKYKIFNSRGSNDNSTDIGNAIDMTLVEERPHISEVGISAMTLSDQSLQYIMRKYPKLQSLSIIYTQSDVCQYSTAILGRFFSFLFNIIELQLAGMTITPQTLEEALIGHFETTKIPATTTTTMDYNFRLYFGTKRHIPPPDVVKTTMRTNGKDTIYIDLKYESRRVTRFVNTITRCGKYMDYLFLDFNHMYAVGNIEYEYDWANGKMVEEFIFKHCTRLTKLYLNSYNFEFLSEGVFTNTTITRLDLDSCEILGPALTMISRSLPSLRDLNIERCELDTLPRFLDVEMRYTKFDTLSIALWRTQNNIGVVRVKELAPGEEGGELFSDKCYKSVHDPDSHDPETSYLALTDSDINEYRALVKGGNCLNVMILCRGLRQLDLYLHPD